MFGFAFQRLASVPNVSGSPNSTRLGEQNDELEKPMVAGHSDERIGQSETAVDAGTRGERRDEDVDASKRMDHCDDPMDAPEKLSPSTKVADKECDRCAGGGYEHTLSSMDDGLEKAASTEGEPKSTAAVTSPAHSDRGNERLENVADGSVDTSVRSELLLASSRDVCPDPTSLPAVEHAAVVDDPTGQELRRRNDAQQSITDELDRARFQHSDVSQHERIVHETAEMDCSSVRDVDVSRSDRMQHETVTRAEVEICERVDGIDVSGHVMDACPVI